MNDNLRNAIIRILNEYTSAKSQTFAGHSMGSFFRNEVPKIIYNTGLVDEEMYLIEGSVGKGNWAMVPWICIFDRTVTTSATKGVYIVYLLSKDGRTLYLSLNQGCTELKNRFGKKEAIRMMRENADAILSNVDNRGFARYDDSVSLGENLTELGELYQKGIILYKAYHRDNVPKSEELYDDLNQMIAVYQDYVYGDIEKEPQKAWLLSWNPDNWNWEDYDEAIASVRDGEVYEIRWSCYSKSVNPGDEVYLTTSGLSDSNGIIASGIAISNTYESDHWDEAKREQGQTSKCIDVRFDCIKNYKSDAYLKQSKLKELFPEQQWSPMGSGISIKDSYVEALAKEWKALNGNDWWPSKEEYDPGLTKERWLELLYEGVFNENALSMFAKMYALGGAATCSQLVKAYGKTTGHYIGIAVQTADKVVNVTDCPRPQAGEQSKLWPVLFLGKESENKDEGSWIWKIRDELNEALVEYGIEKHLPKTNIDSKLGKFDSWEIVDEVTAIKHCDKSFFDYNGSGVPKDICWFFDAESIPKGNSKPLSLMYDGKNYKGVVVNDTTDRRRIQIRWNSDLGNCFEKHRCSNAIAVFKKTAENKYEITMSKEGENEMTIKDKISAIKAYIAAKGFNYEGDLIENFYLSLKSKPFVILAGTSGTGKTRLVKLFAEAIGAEMKLVPVRPDWSDSSDLFGHTDLSNKFHPGAIIDFVKKAEWNKDKPFFLCLDEMNLARVEYYLSDFLSIIETRDRKETGDIETDPLIDVDYYKDENAKGKYGRVFIPENLYIIGTVNMDETTFPFSKKVLDRANTIEFSFVNLMSKPEETIVEPKKLSENNSFLKTEYLYLRDCDDSTVIDSVCFDLEELNQILVKANLHVGYRIRDEISFYMINNKKADLLSENIAFDHEIMQKVLPRIQGSSTAIKDVLAELFVKCAGDYTGFGGISTFEQMNSYIDQKDCKYPNSAKKIAFMMRRYEEDGFTSYWL